MALAFHFVNALHLDGGPADAEPALLPWNKTPRSGYTILSTHCQSRFAKVSLGTLASVILGDIWPIIVSVCVCVCVPIWFLYPGNAGLVK